MEPIRLVIWDLDGVFWQGTLAEEGMTPRPEAIAAVKALAARGIISSICSKNDFAAAEAALRAQGVWEYFVFPSIDWTPKGARIAGLVEAVQLRAPTVLFIDDLPANLAEAQASVPGLQVASEALVPHLLSHPLLRGKDDAALTRLNQYRLLQTRHQAAARAGDDHLAFLRQSGIRVVIDYDVERNIDRAVELINRTNQMNFTKARLPEEPEAARAALRELIARFDAVAGLVRVADRYGDYGVVGLYVGRIWYGVRTLSHFCFSCRVLGMGVEAFVHRRLGRPALEVRGEVVGDPFAEVDWITEVKGLETPVPAVPRGVDRLILRGGCDLMAMSHYLAPVAAHSHTEVNLRRADRPFRLDHSLVLQHVFTPPTPERQAALAEIGYVPADWTSELAVRRPGERQVWVLSFWTDDFARVYRHKRTGLVMPFLAQFDARATEDLTTYSEEAMRGIMTAPENFSAWEALCRDWVCEGTLTQAQLTPVIVRLMAAAHAQGAMVVIMLGPETWRYSLEAPPHPRPQAAQVNEWLRAAAHDAVFVDLRDFMAPDTAYPDMLHYDRQVYQRGAAHIAGLIAQRFGG
jgi:FkbH-like protein